MVVSRRLTQNVGFVVLAMLATIPISHVARSQTQVVPTFSKDVAPIFQNKCEACHRVDSIAPMSLVTYQETKAWAKNIRERVIARTMPPWGIDKSVGIQHFANDRSLSDKEIETIVKWVDGGSPQGDPKDLPAAKKWPGRFEMELCRALRRPTGPYREISALHGSRRRYGCLVQTNR
jgi:hypothetical protein